MSTPECPWQMYFCILPAEQEHKLITTYTENMKMTKYCFTEFCTKYLKGQKLFRIFI